MCEIGYIHEVFNDLDSDTQEAILCLTEEKIRSTPYCIEGMIRVIYRPDDVPTILEVMRSVRDEFENELNRPRPQ